MTALLFPGQGTQRVGMGQALRMAFPLAVTPVLDEAGALDPELATLMRHGPEAQLAQTQHAQLAVTATNLAALAVLRGTSESFGPDSLSSVSGHSVGFLSALVAAGSVDVGAALELAKTRGELMGAMPPGGAMASIIGLGLAEVEDLTVRSAHETGGVVVVGLVNGPSAIVVSGDEPAVERACGLAADLGARFARLPVSHAFHSPHMLGACEPWRDVVRGAEFRPPAVALIADLTGEIVDSPSRIRELLVDQLTCAVRWDLVLARLADRGEAEAIEAGDSKVLRGFARNRSDLHVSSMAEPKTLARFRPPRERLPVSAAARLGQEPTRDAVDD